MEKEQLIHLVTRSQAGDQTATEKLLQYAHTSVSYQCRKMLGNAQDAEDMTQEVLLTIYTKLDTLQDPAAFRKWANQITATRCINALNRTHVEYQFAEDAEGHSILDNLEELDEQVIPDKAIDNAETARMIEQIVDSLPDAQRAATLMFYYNEMSVKEIAKTMQVSENTVKSRLNYARKAIKEQVLDYEKQGIKLYGLSPLPFLLYFLRMAARMQKDEEAAAVLAAKVMASGGAAAGVGAGAGAAAMAAGTGAAGTATATGIFAGISAKVIVGILAGLLTISGVAAVAVSYLQGNNPAPTVTPTESITATADTRRETIPETSTATVPATTETVTEPTEAEVTEPAATEVVATTSTEAAPPATEPPETESPATEPPATEPPATEPPATEPPATEPPATEPPATEEPGSSEESESGDCPSCGIGNLGAVLVSEATCVYRGEVAWQCSHCGHIAGYSYPPAWGHTMVDGVCTTCGTSENTCEHIYDSGVEHWPAGTMTWDPYILYTCTLCGHTYQELIDYLS